METNCDEMNITHKDFKSIDPRIQDAETMDDFVGHALSYQYMFDKRTTPWEKSQWSQEELEKFRVDLEKIDRLYYIYHIDDAGGQGFALTGRMDCKGQSVYIELDANCDFTGFDCQGGGTIFISSDANLFMKIIPTEKYNMDAVRKSLAEDGILLDDIDEYDKYSRTFWSNPPMLTYLCHKTVYDNKEHLRHYNDVLPKILKNSIKDFIRYKEAKEDYDNFSD